MRDSIGITCTLPDCPECGAGSFLWGQADYLRNVYVCARCGTEYGHPMGAPRHPGDKNACESAGRETAERVEKAFWKALLGES